MKSAKGLVPYLGGKRNLASRIVPMIEAIPHRCYAEPFVGAGGIFFRRTKPAVVEAINDAGGEIVNLFRIVQRHPKALLDQLRLDLHARATFDRLLASNPATLTDIERAARFHMLQGARFRSDPTDGSFISNPATARGKSPVAVRRHLLASHRRLARVTIERLDFEVFIKRYDRPDTLIYVDPPYWGCEADYGDGLFSRADFGRLEAVLKGLRGRFVLSLNDRPEIRRLFAWASIQAVETTYGSIRPIKAAELIITSPGR
ncbi:DNA adenine methylase [Oleomonas cavernae]|uniref:site-specific DNA-methyltransferase (adenine-specific) n=1 Tax=Oleomonas cavernae TaxID=2320859 RepID=A0A418WU53_9PROT|nr:DNA adenine methylase [Oleomonas cavernae]RJF94792.1 DNA adenine methylase [Oleomonas cavernae]